MPGALNTPYCIERSIDDPLRNLPELSQPRAALIPVTVTSTGEANRRAERAQWLKLLADD